VVTVSLFTALVTCVGFSLITVLFANLLVVLFGNLLGSLLGFGGSGITFFSAGFFGGGCLATTSVTVAFFCGAILGATFLGAEYKKLLIEVTLGLFCLITFGESIELYINAVKSNKCSNTDIIIAV